MNHPVWLMLMDLVIGGLLAATLFFAIRLSRQLADFRAGRADLDRLVKDLGKQVDDAQDAIQSLKETARASGKALQDRIDSARNYSEELQIVSESANSLAGRLERGAAAKPKTGDNFTIRDTELDPRKPAANLSNKTTGPKQLSRAEQELTDALRKRQPGAS